MASVHIVLTSMKAGAETLLAAETIASSAVNQQSAAAVVAAGLTAFWHVDVSGGDAWVASGANPDAAAEPRWRMHDGETRRIGAADGQKIAVLTAPRGLLGAGTDRSGAITVGGTAQPLAAANASRRTLKGQNISTADLWINEDGGTAAADTAGSFRVRANGKFSIDTNEAVSIVGATTGQKFSATET